VRRLPPQRAGKTKFACVDGPDFDGHEVDWKEFLNRRRTYNPEEVHPLRKSGCASTFNFGNKMGEDPRL